MPASWHEGGVREEAEDLNQPLLATRTSGVAEGEMRPLKLEGLAVALAGLKGAEDGPGVILRVYEPAGARGGVRLDLPEGWRVAGPVDLLERPVEARGEMLPFEVRSWRVVRA